jgi:hypothetical protein
VPVEIHLYQGQSHEFTALPSMLAPVHAQIALFLKRTMVDPASYERENCELNPFAAGLPPRPTPLPETAA